MLAEFVTGLPSDLRYAVEVRHRDRPSDMVYRFLEDHHAAVALADLYYTLKLDRVTTNFTYIWLLGTRSGTPDAFSPVRLDREPELALWAGRFREYLEHGLTLFLSANTRFQGHRPAPARAFLAKVAGVGSQS